ncbi:MAG: arginine deiminase-related protein, partial [Gordonia sp. (in: high G+C Gram-positive bacteria)]
FAGNSLELRGRTSRRILALSTTAAASLTPAQREVIESSCDLLALDVSPVELAGGSVRCMIAGIHLESRSTTSASPTSVSPARTAADAALRPL